MDESAPSVRLRAFLAGDVVVEDGEYTGSWGRHRTQRVGAHGQSQVYLVDSIVPASSEELRDQLPVAHDSLRRFADRVASKTYSTAEIQRLVSFAPVSVAVDDEFSLLVPGPPGARSLPELTPTDLADDSVDSVATRAYSLLRKALAPGRPPDDRLVSLFAFGELVARRKAEPLMRECAECGAESKIGLATWRYLRTRLTDLGADAEKIEAFRDLRNDIAHGHAKHDSSFFRRVNSVLAEVEGRIQEMASDDIGLDLPPGARVHAYDSWVELRFRVSAFDFEMITASVGAPVQVATRGDLTGSKFEAFYGFSGYPMALKWGLEPAVWPNVKSQESPPPEAS